MDKIIFHINTFHEKADDTITWSLNTARAFNKKAFFLHIVDPRDDGWYPPHADSQSFIQDMTTEELRKKEVAEAHNSFDKKLSKLLSLMKNPPVADFKSEEGMTENKLIEYSKNQDTYLISVNNTTKRNDEDLYNQYNHFIKESQCPILLVHDVTGTAQLRNMAYLTDFKKEDVPVIQSLTNMSRVLGAKLQSYHVDPKRTFQEKVKDLQHDDRFVNADEVSETGSIHNIKKEDMVEAVREIQENDKPDLLVVLKENQNFWQKLFDKSNAKKVISETHIPVLIFHEKSEDFAKI